MTQLLQGISNGLSPSESISSREAPKNYDAWLRRIYPSQFSSPFAEHHHEYWRWIEGVELRKPYDPYEAILFCLARAGGKSMNAETSSVYLAAKNKRRVFGYCCATLKQANDHISSIARRLESKSFSYYYPAHSSRQVYKYTQGNWSQSRIATASGAFWVAIGIDAANRGFRFDDLRIDCLYLDDVDDLRDSQRVTANKLSTIQNTILPMGSNDMITIFIQNQIHQHSAMSQILERRSEIMSVRQQIGPIPALVDAEFERRKDTDGVERSFITKGEPTWDGQSLDTCQRYINRHGLAGFLRECQHDVEDREGALWTHLLINETRVGVEELPRDGEGNAVFKRIVIGVDPSGGSAEIGIIAVGLGHNGHCYVLRDGTQPGPAGPANWGRMVIVLYDELDADLIAAEANYGGDMVKANIRVYSKNAPVKMVSATRGKAVRAEPVRTLYEEDLVHHVGVFPKLEAEMTSWVPDRSTESPNRIDALVWAVTELMLGDKVFTGGAGVIRVNRGR